jgi:hypothetical protein
MKVKVIKWICHSERSEESLPAAVVPGRDASTPPEFRFATLRLRSA